jgi:hypothetical protein
MTGWRFERDAEPPEGGENDPLVAMPIPPLVTLLHERERAKGAPLTEPEVLSIRDDAVSMMVRLSTARIMARDRGFDDIDPENAWVEWQLIRGALGADD